MAALIRVYVPHLQMFPCIADAIASSEGLGLDSKSAEAVMI